MKPCHLLNPDKLTEHDRAIIKAAFDRVTRVALWQGIHTKEAMTMVGKELKLARRTKKGVENG
jgi:hypothetical protein